MRCRGRSRRICSSGFARSGSTRRAARRIRVYNLLVRLLFGVKVRDDSFNKFVHRRVLDAIRLGQQARCSSRDRQLLWKRGARASSLASYRSTITSGDCLSSFNPLRAVWVTLEIVKHV